MRRRFDLELEVWVVSPPAASVPPSKAASVASWLYRRWRQSDVRRGLRIVRNRRPFDG
jgi:hypothetical protein